MDTWTAENNRLWLRDLLPASAYFDKSRIMTFGYDSGLTCRASHMQLDDWADTLLHSIDNSRTSDKAGS
jgi:hypothetical protein